MNLYSETYIYPQPNDVYDFLMASQQKLTHWQLRKLALQNGILVTENITREALCRKIATQVMDHKTFAELIESTQAKPRPSKSMSQRLLAEVEVDAVSNTLSAMKEKFYRDSFDIKINPKTGKQSLNITYIDTNHSVTRLKQRKVKEAVIEFEKNEDGNTTIRYPSDEHVTDIVKSLVSVLSDNSDENYEVFSIDLSALKAEQLNDFFIKLITNIEGIPLFEVIKIGLQKSSDFQVEEDELDSISASITANINNARLSGSDLLNSGKIHEFLQDEYFIHTIRWKSNKILINERGSERIEGCVILEVQAEPSHQPVTLAYEAINYFKYSEENDTYLKNSNKLEDMQRKKYIKLIEQAAYKSFEEVTRLCDTSGFSQLGD